MNEFLPWGGGGVWCFRVAALEARENQTDRLEFVKNQLNLLIAEIKKKIKAISEDVESKVSLSRSSLPPDSETWLLMSADPSVEANRNLCFYLVRKVGFTESVSCSNWTLLCFTQVSIAMGEEICRLHVIVDEFHADFHPSPQVLKIYKSVSEAFTQK